MANRRKRQWTLERRLFSRRQQKRDIVKRQSAHLIEEKRTAMFTKQEEVDRKLAKRHHVCHRARNRFCVRPLCAIVNGKGATFAELSEAHGRDPSTKGRTGQISSLRRRKTKASGDETRAEGTRPAARAAGSMRQTLKDVITFDVAGKGGGHTYQGRESA